jgi:hypothetical protein
MSKRQLTIGLVLFVTNLASAATAVTHATCNFVPDTNLTQFSTENNIELSKLLTLKGFKVLPALRDPGLEADDNQLYLSAQYAIEENEQSIPVRVTWELQLFDTHLTILQGSNGGRLYQNSPLADKVTGTATSSVTEAFLAGLSELPNCQVAQ